MPAEAVRERVSECPVCPSWVSACAHWAGSTLFMGFWDGPECGCARSSITMKFGDGAFKVLLTSKPFTPCPVTGSRDTPHSWDAEARCWQFHNELAAQAEFTRRDELLRQGEPARG